MGFFDNVRSKVIDWLFTGQSQDTGKTDAIMDRREYRLGMQKKFIRRNREGVDDNLILNFTGLAVDRGVSLLFGKGIDFDYGEEPDERVQVYLDGVWDANKEDILLHRLAIGGAESGMCFVKIIPRDGQAPRLVAIDPSLIDIDPDPDDMDKVLRYTIQYKSVDSEGREIAKKEITEWTRTSDEDPNSGYWLISTYVTTVGGKWQLVSALNWEWDFSPICHWQNLPNVFDAWGLPDITADVMELQDRINFDASNIQKIIRLYAHPQRYGRMTGKAESVEMGPDKYPTFNNPAAEIVQLSPVSDLESSRLFLLTLRQSLFDITRTVDITSLADKLGALTNFGLRVLYQDALAKLETKRSLYAEGIAELNRRLLILGGFEGIPPDIIWGDVMPKNELENLQADEIKLRIGIVDKQTVALEEGYDWEIVQDRLQEEKAGQDNLGSTLLRAFDMGQTEPGA